MDVRIYPSIANGKLFAPYSKSYAHRYLIASFLSNKKSSISNIELSEDIKATLFCLKELGCNYSYSNQTVSIEKIENEKDIYHLDANESGSTLRFLIPIALLTGKDIVFSGKEKLFSRGLKPYIEIFKRHNIGYKLTKDKLYLSGKLTPGNYEISDNSSSQYITGLLFALPLLNGTSYLKVPKSLQSKNYISITLDVLKNAGIEVTKIGNIYVIDGNQTYKNDFYINEIDYSNAAFLDAFNYLNGNVSILNLKEDSYQGDKVYKKHFDSLSSGFSKIDIKDCIDLGPILFVFSTLFYGGHFINTKRLKIKESDRILDLKEELEKFNVSLTVLDNEVIIDNSNMILKECILNSHNDHRLAMALSILLSKTGGVIKNAECVNKSYPAFFKDLKGLGIKVIKDV